MCTAGEQIAKVAGEKKSEGLNPEGAQEVVLDKGYDSNEALRSWRSGRCVAIVRSPTRGARCWEGKKEGRTSRGLRQPGGIRGERGKRLLRQRGEKVERSFAHCYATGGMRRVHLRHHPNILKRLLVHAAAFNLGLIMRKVLGQLPFNLVLTMGHTGSVHGPFTALRPMQKPNRNQ